MGERAVCEPDAGQFPAGPHSRMARKVLTTGVVGIAVTASTFLGASAAVAETPVVISSCMGTTASNEFGQPILASPAALGAKFEQATLLAYPFQFDLAKQAKQEFLAADPVRLGTVAGKAQTFSGKTLAEALSSRVAGISAIDDHAEDVVMHLENLAALGCLGGVKVPGQEAPPPEEPTSEQPSPQRPPSSERPQPSQQPQPSSSARTTDATVPETAVAPFSAPGVLPGAVPLLAPPPQFGQLPPAGASLVNSDDQRRQVRDAEVRAAGNAEAMPADVNKRVALPVMIAAIVLALVTGALVRTWVLRRS